MHKIMHDCIAINDIFESIYVYKSIVICTGPRQFVHTQQTLSAMLFPVESLTHISFEQTVARFKSGSVRMLIMSEMMFELISARFVELLQNVNAVFVVNGAHIDENKARRALAGNMLCGDSLEIFSL